MDNRYKLDTIAIRARYWDEDNDRFTATDSEERFQEHLKTMPANWSYRTKEIRYTVNSLGYRTKELSDIDQNNFFIAYGCSFTYGVGLAEDELWTATVANELGIECFNLGMGGCGMDYIYLNTMTYLKNTDIKPKFVIIQCPDPARMVMRSLDNFETSGPSFPGTDAALIMYKQAIKDNSYLHNTYLAWHSTMTFWKAAGVPVYVWSIDNIWCEIIPNGNIGHHWPTNDEMTAENRARDLMHFSASYQIRTGKNIAEIIRNDPKFGIDPVDNTAG